MTTQLTAAAPQAAAYATRENQTPVSQWLEQDFQRWYKQMHENRSVVRKSRQYEVFNPGVMDLPRGIAVLKVVVK